MRNFIKNTAFKINILLAVMLLLSYLSAWISPKHFWLISLPGVLYPFFLIVNVACIVFWLVFRKWNFLLSFIVICIGFSFITRYVQVNLPFKKKPDIGMTLPEKSLKVLSFNVRLFNLYKWVNLSDVQKEIFEFVRKESPDVICFQEYYTHEKGKYSDKDILKYLSVKYKYVRYTYRKPGTSNFGIATFSKYPIINAGEVRFEKTFNQCIFTDIKTGKDTIRIFNVHLQSFRFKKSNYDFIDTLKFAYNPGQVQGARDIIYRLKTAFIKRAQQADLLTKKIQHSSIPVIVCGDFNDSPVSYSYQHISKGMKDAFIESGQGYGNTYFTKFPSYRIDYILYQPMLMAYNYQNPKLNLSDHYPVLCEFVIKK